MTAIGHVVRLMSLSVGTEDSVECAVTSCDLVPSFSTVTTEVACPDGVKTDAGPTSWVFTVGYNVDAGADSFSTYLAEHDGEVVSVEWLPDPVNHPTRARQFDVVCKPGNEGHPVGQFAAGTVSLPVQGTPAWGTPTP